MGTGGLRKRLLEETWYRLWASVRGFGAAFMEIGFALDWMLSGRRGSVILWVGIFINLTQEED